MKSKTSQPTVVSFCEEVLDRMVQAHERIQAKVKRTCELLQQADVPFALCGSNATANWIATVDEGAVRGIRNVEVLFRRCDLLKATESLKTAGFVPLARNGQLRFHDGESNHWRHATEVTLAGEPVQGKSPECTAPQADRVELLRGLQTLQLSSLVEFQLARFRLDDAVDLRDMIGVGLIDELWPAKLQPELGQRLQELLDDPDG